MQEVTPLYFAARLETEIGELPDQYVEMDMHGDGADYHDYVKVGSTFDWTVYEGGSQVIHFYEEVRGVEAPPLDFAAWYRLFREAN